MMFKNSDLVMFGGAAIAAFLLYQIWQKKGGKVGGVVDMRGDSMASIISDAGGWKVYSNGVAISPDGRYLKDGVEVYNPAGMYGVA
jgi:hypothetical protein